ncbi:ester cyclase [Streptomyces sp. NPDC090052]|uniref:ester cyclase n=1 Tax=Streptomyces sp. NPDC090052 TaxID=3365931 RepID=UPI00382DE1FE
MGTGSTDIRERIAAAWGAAWQRGEVDALDTVLADGYRRHGRTAQDAADLKANITACRAGFPDLVTVIEDCVVEGDRVATRWVSRGTHTGRLMDVPPTGRTVTVSGATFSRIEDGMVAEEWVTWDPRQLLTALGIIPLDSARAEAPAQAAAEAQGRHARSVVAS